MKCVHPIKVGYDRFYGYRGLPSYIEVPCGRCIACRINKAKEWTGRCLMEYDYWDDAVYLTLTYDNEHIPDDRSVHKSVLQKFFKRLRKDLDSRPIKYFACGEYGGKFGRCHYHALIFGLNAYKDYDMIVKAWSFGHVEFGPVIPKTIGYVCGYVSKKITDYKADDLYRDSGFEPPFRIMSRGIGDRFVEQHKDILRERGFTFMNVHYPISKRYNDDLFTFVERLDRHVDSFFKCLENLDNKEDELRALENRLIAKFNNFKAPSERKKWR